MFNIWYIYTEEKRATIKKSLKFVAKIANELNIHSKRSEDRGGKYNTYHICGSKEYWIYIMKFRCTQQEKKMILNNIKNIIILENNKYII